MSDFVIIHCTV